MIHFGRAPYSPFSGSGSLTMDASGHITGGSVTNFGVDIQQFTGGSLVMTPEGKVTGTMDAFLKDSDTTGRQTIHSGRILSQKDKVVYSASLTLARKGIGILLKKAGSYSPSDLEGTWVFPLEGVFAVSLNSEGIMNQCAYQSPGGDLLQCSGHFSINAEGSISGDLDFRDKKVFTTKFNGSMSPEKNSMILAGGISTRFEGMATLAVKQGKGVSLSDGKGTWGVFLSTYDNVLYGTIDMNESGIVSGGEWTTANKGAGTFTGGVIVLKEPGDVSGTFSTSAGNTYTIIGGSMISSKNLMCLSVKDKAGLSDVLILAR